MMIALHKNARTMPAIRTEIAASADSAAQLAHRFGVTQATIYKWKKHQGVHDRSHTAHRLQTTLTPEQERIVVELRSTLLLPLDDLRAVTRAFISAKASRSGLDRCLRRHGLGNLQALKPQPAKEPHKALKAYDLHIDVKYLPQMPDETRRRCLFVAIDRAMGRVFARINQNKTAASAKATAQGLSNEDSEGAHRQRQGVHGPSLCQPDPQALRNHEYDLLCHALGIEHRLTQPRTPKTNGMVERFNGRVSDVLNTHRFTSDEVLEQTGVRYVAVYTHHLPQSALKSKPPMQAMKDWYASHPHLFHKRLCGRPGCDRQGLGQHNSLPIM